VFGEAPFLRGDVYELRSDPAAKGREQQGPRFAVILQNSSIPLSTVIVAPTSTSRSSSSFRPEVRFKGRETRVLVEHMRSVDPAIRLGRKVAHLTYNEIQQIGMACATLLDL